MNELYDKVKGTELEEKIRLEAIIISSIVKSGVHRLEMLD